MPEFIRVRDQANGHELSVIKSASLDGYEVIDEAADKNGVPLPPKHHTPAPKKKPGRQADITEENI